MTKSKEKSSNKRINEKISALNNKIDDNRKEINNLRVRVDAMFIDIKKILEFYGIDSWQETMRKRIEKKDIIKP